MQNRETFQQFIVRSLVYNHWYPAFGTTCQRSDSANSGHRYPQDYHNSHNKTDISDDNSDQSGSNS